MAFLNGYKAYFKIVMIKIFVQNTSFHLSGPEWVNFFYARALPTEPITDDNAIAPRPISELYVTHPSNSKSCPAPVVVISDRDDFFVIYFHEKFPVLPNNRVQLSVMIMVITIIIDGVNLCMNYSP